MRIRGVPVGSVLTVNPSLEKVEVLVEVSASLVHDYIQFQSALLWSHACTLAHGCTRLQELCSDAACWAQALGIESTEGSGRSTVA